MVASSRVIDGRPAPVLAFEDLLSLLETDRSVAQSHDDLMTQLRLLGRKPLKTLLFTSTQPAEGKTTVVVMHALALALAGERVLVVDADMRRPTLHRLMRVEMGEGLATALADPMRAGEVIQTVELPGTGGRSAAVGVVTAGPPTDTPPFQSLASSALAEALGSLAADYDRVLIDSPPILSVADPLLLAPLVDGVVMVVRTGAVEVGDARLAMERLRRASGDVLGVVMNHFDDRLHGKSLHPYHAHYLPDPNSLPGPDSNAEPEAPAPRPGRRSDS